MMHRSTACLLAVAALAGCSPESSVEWLEGAGYRWDLFNHRLSYLHVAVDERGPEIAVVGGTSTTGLQTELAPECESATCSELPLVPTPPADHMCVCAPSLS